MHLDYKKQTLRFIQCIILFYFRLLTRYYLTVYSRTVFPDYFIINSINNIYIFFNGNEIVFTYLLLYIYKLSEMLTCYIDY